MHKKIFTGFIIAVMLGLSGCAVSSGTESTQGNDDTEYSVYGTDDGAVTYDFGGGNNAAEVSGDPIERNGNTVEVSAPDGSISIDKAKELVDSCSFEKFYLPVKTADCGKYYYGTINIGCEEYYSMCFYLEKNSLLMYVGTDFAVSCDGKEVLKKNWTGTYEEVELGSSSDDKTFDEMYEGAEITPEEALFALNGVEAEKLGLTEKLSSYTFEIDSKLYTRKSIKCYQITPKLNYENGITLGSPIYVTADGTNRIMMYDSAGDDYVKIN